MQIKRFHESDMRRAMRRVRKALGPDAVILETEESDTGVEITAAVDFDHAAYQRELESRKAQTPASEIETTQDWLAERGDVKEEPAQPTNWQFVDKSVSNTANLEITALREEITSMRALLEQQVSRLVWDDKARRSPEVTRIMRNLTGLGVTPDVVTELTDDIDAAAGIGDSWTSTLRSLVDRIPVCESEVVMDGGIFAVIGPTGAGKTTSIAKLAARYALRNGADDIALVTTDTFRIGARAQLQTFGEILDTPVYQANDAQSLSDTLTNLAHKKLILIDTAGMGAHDLRLAREMAVLGDAEQKIQTLLTLPANLQTGALQDIADTFAVANPVACILTKTDEASTLGGIFSVLMRSGLPLAYIANGQRVPDDLHLAKSRQSWLVKAAVEMMHKQEFPITDEYLAQQFSEEALNEYA
jgi:flagellar biosynthesis protein FlhF